MQYLSTILQQNIQHVKSIMTVSKISYWFKLLTAYKRFNIWICLLSATGFTGFTDAKLTTLKATWRYVKLRLWFLYAFVQLHTTKLKYHPAHCIKCHSIVFGFCWLCCIWPKAIERRFNWNVLCLLWTSRIIVIANNIIIGLKLKTAFTQFKN